MRPSRWLPALLLLPLLAAPAAAQTCPDYNPYKNPYFGDLHVHTSYSLDAYGFGTRNDPADAFDFARGGELTLSNGKVIHLPRPLDFSIVSDHSEMFDTLGECVWPMSTAEGTLYLSAYCQRARELLHAYGTHGNPWPLMEPITQDWPQEPYADTSSGRAYLCTQLTDPYCWLARRNIWQRQRDWAEQANNACTFTTFPAYEWSASPARPFTLDSLTNANLHRIILFASGTVPTYPLDFVHYPTPLALLYNLDQQCKPSEGCEALSIPHNSNLSKGLMFALDLQANGTEGDDKGLEALYRVKYERLVEVFQHKGGSECLFVDPSDVGYDDQCAYENLSWLEATLEKQRDLPGYARSGLTKGLRWRTAGNINPFQFGLVGATDTHNATPGQVAEDAYEGHGSYNDDTAEKRVRSSAGFNPGGLTGVWAEQNTRQSLFAALKRRETYATSGPRMVVRFYQTWDETSDPCADASFPAQLVQGGAVPMGGTMPPSPAPGRKPRFVVHAMMDQTRLHEINIVKVSVTSPTAPEVAKTLKFQSPDPGGQAVWCHVWTDAEFDPAAAAYYYARVLELPTWRWSHHDCQKLRAQYPNDWQTRFPKCDCAADPLCIDRPMRERAWSSPIWHHP